MTRTTRRTLGVAGLLVVMGIGFLVEERVRGEWMWRAWQRELVERGEKLTVRELTPQVEVGSPVRALTPQEMQAFLSGTGGLSSRFPSGMRFVAPGKARVSWALERWDDPMGKGVLDWSKVQGESEALREQLANLRREFATAPVRVHLDYELWIEMMLPHLAAYKGASQACAAGVLLALHEGRRAEALADLEMGIALVDLARQELTIIGQLVTVATGAILVGSTWELLQAPGWTEEELAGLQARWEQVQFLESMAQAQEMERAMTSRYFDRDRLTEDQFIEATTGLPGVFGGSGGSGDERPTGALGELFQPIVAAGERLRLRVFFQIWRFAWARHDQRFHHQTMQAVIEDVRKSARERRWAGRSPVNEALEAGDVVSGRSLRGRYNVVRHVLSRGIMPALSRAADKAVRMEAHRDLVVTAIALERYRLRHGALPAGLEALVPEFLRQTPRDWHDGEPLRYQVREGGEYLLYCVGEDGRDDGGDSRVAISAAGDRARYSLHSGRDWVWPRRATREEVMADADRD